MDNDFRPVSSDSSYQPQPSAFNSSPPPPPPTPTPSVQSWDQSSPQPAQTPSQPEWAMPAAAVAPTWQTPPAPVSQPWNAMPAAAPMPWDAVKPKAPSWKSKLRMPSMGGGGNGAGFANPPLAQSDAMAVNPATLGTPGTGTELPIPVVQVLSVRGLEYYMMMLLLWFSAASLLWVSLALVNGQSGFSILAFPVSTLLVCMPIFSWLFIRLKRAEVLNPALRFDPSKRRSTQTTQIVTFLVVIFNLIAFIYQLMAKVGGGVGLSTGKAFLNMLVILVIVGGIFAYYWVDEHKSRR